MCSEDSFIANVRARVMASGRPEWFNQTIEWTTGTATTIRVTDIMRILMNAVPF